MEMRYPRRKTREVCVGDVTIGGQNPIVVQSMITENTRDVTACINSIIRLHKLGCELVRVTTPTLSDAHSLEEIKKGLNKRRINIPLVADVHHQGTKIAETVARTVDKVRINPGLFVFQRLSDSIEYTPKEYDEARLRVEADLVPVVKVCRERDIAMRIGVNHGSLSDRMTVTFGDTPLGMVESALEFIRICEEHNYHNLIVSLKASRVPIMLEANRLMASRMEEEGMDYPLHLGVTEAGDGEYARIKSTSGIGTLLAEGLGDTIRVSLAEDPANEIPVCYDILQALNLRRTKVEFIACPSCGRTKFHLENVLAEVKSATNHLVGLDIAVMGCIVNGPGEMAGADYGYVGKANGIISLYRGHECVKMSVPQDHGVIELINLIKSDGRWVDP